MDPVFMLVLGGIVEAFEFEHNNHLRKAKMPIAPACEAEDYERTCTPNIVKSVSRIFITDSADGLGLMAAKFLMDKGRSVVLHARSESRANEVRKAVSEAKEWATDDLNEGTSHRHGSQ